MSWLRGQTGSGPTTLLTSSRSVPAELWSEDDSCSSSERGFVRALSAVALDTMVPVQMEVLPCRAKKWAAKRRVWSALLVVFAVLLGVERRFGGQAIPKSGEAEVSEEGRSYLKADSIYQNDYMTLWNANEVAISATLHMQDMKHFELRISNLDSKGGGNDGWFAVKGSFRLQPVDDEGRRLTIVPPKKSEGKSDMVFSFDETLHDGAALFLYRCLKRLGGPGILNFLQLEVDAVEDSVIVKPTARLLRALWDQPVKLRLTSEGKLWTASNPPKA